MKIKSSLLSKLSQVERIASLSKSRRFLNNPIKYFNAIFFREFIYPKHKKEKVTHARLFYGPKMKIALPASTDIYLTGGKSHSSEIRLAKFLIQNLNEGDSFLDIGAHFGYFTLLAFEIVGENGKIVSFEPASKSFKLLEQNVKGKPNVQVEQKAICNSNEKISFYEFPDLYSEYNSSYISQFQTENWFSKFKPREVKVNSISIDTLTMEQEFLPAIIKIDVEGGEFNVIDGARLFLSKHSTIIAMEYLAAKRSNTAHVKAANLLNTLGYKANIISDSGNIEPIIDIDTYLHQSNLDSDNIVFSKL